MIGFLCLKENPKMIAEQYLVISEENACSMRTMKVKSKLKMQGSDFSTDNGIRKCLLVLKISRNNPPRLSHL